MQYDPKELDRKWQKYWAEKKTFRADLPLTPSQGGGIRISPSLGGGQGEVEKPKYYVLDMFPYPSGAGLHVGHPLGYIASDIVSRYKRLKGFNVLHPMGYDSFGLPAEQYAIQTGQHPAKTTEENIATYRRQMDSIGFSFDWDREVRTSDPSYYKWTQWIFLKLYDSWYDKTADKARPIANLISFFGKIGNEGVNAHCDETPIFSADEWNSWDRAKQQTILLNYRIAYLSEAYVNWCPALGTVLANDEVKDGFSERGGHPVERKLMMQWSMRITAYAQRLLDGLDGLEWSESLKEQQRNWIGRSEGALLRFEVMPDLSYLSPDPSPKERGEASKKGVASESDDAPGYVTADAKLYGILKDKAKAMRHDPTEAEDALWQKLRRTPDGHHFRRQHIIGRYIADFVCLKRQLIVEVDGSVHDHAQEEDFARTSNLEEMGFQVIRFTNAQVVSDVDDVVAQILKVANTRPDFSLQIPLPASGGWGQGEADSPLLGRGAGGEVIEVFTTRPDTIFGVSFMVLAPEHELVSQITTAEQKAEVEAYIAKAKARSDRDRMADVKTVSGAFTGAYAEHPFTGAPIPIWIGDYVLAGYGTGAVMAVPSGDQRDWNFATHFNLPIPQVVKAPNADANSLPLGEGQGGVNSPSSGRGRGEVNEVYDGKDGTLINSDFLNGLPVKEAIKRAIGKLEEKGIGKGRINYRLRDAVFGRQRYWGEPIPIYYKDGIPYPVKEEHLPVTLPEIDEYLPTETGEPPLGRAKGWGYDPERGAIQIPPSSGGGQGEVNSPLLGRGVGGEVFPFELSTMPGWAGSSWYFLRYMNPNNPDAFASKETIDYWQNVDLYVGGSEHATGHLLYVRFWTKFLKDLGYLPFDEPAKKLVNQGMIQGVSAKLVADGTVYDGGEEGAVRSNTFLLAGVGQQVGFGEHTVVQGIYSADLPDGKINSTPNRMRYDKRVPLEFVNSDDTLMVEKYVNSVHGKEHFEAAFFTSAGYWRKGVFKEYKPENGAFPNSYLRYADFDESKMSPRFFLTREVEKMSKSKFNVVNPDDIISRYGADTLRLYEMFLGPLEDAKPWNTSGIEGTYRFLRKFWNLFHAGDAFSVSDATPTKAELKALHATIKKVEEDIEKLSLNTSVSQFMICVNELTELKCNKRAILEPLTIVLSSFAPHICEELWEKLGHAESITFASYPRFEAAHLVEDSFSYPISFNGKTKLQLELSTALSAAEVEAIVVAHPEVIKRLEGATPKKVIVVVKRIVNVVV